MDLFFENQWVIGIGCGLIVGAFFLFFNKSKTIVVEPSISWPQRLWKIVCFSIVGSFLLIMLAFVFIFVSEFIKQGIIS